MITAEDIKIAVRPNESTFTTHVMASLRLNNAVQLSEYFLATRNREDAFRESIRSACRGIWHKLYGDIDKELNELRREVCYNLRPEVSGMESGGIEERFTALQAKLRGPS